MCVCERACVSVYVRVRVRVRVRERGGREQAPYTRISYTRASAVYENLTYSSRIREGWLDRPMTGICCLLEL